MRFNLKYKGLAARLGKRDEAQSLSICDLRMQVSLSISACP